MPARFDLTGKVAIVTGAGMGIGRQLARALAEHGAGVAVVDINAELAERVAEEIGQSGATAAAIVADVTNPTDVEQLVQSTVERFGAIDLLVNNAGGGKGSGPTVDIALDEWRATIDLTLTSAFLCSQRVGRVMIGQGRGKIINIASVYGLVGHDPSLYELLPDGRRSESLAYATAKGAMVSMTRALAVYWAPHNINVNAIAPGMVRTERLSTSVSAETWERLSARTPLGRPAAPEDIAGAAIYLASAASDYVTGQTLVVDGGWTAW